MTAQDGHHSRPSPINAANTHPLDSPSEPPRLERIALSIFIAGGGSNLFTKLRNQKDEFELLRFATQRYAYDPEIEDRIIPLYSDESQPESNVSLRAVRWMAYRALRDVVEAKWPAINLREDLRRIAFDDTILDLSPNQLPPDYTGSFGFPPKMIGVGLSSSVLSTYTPKGGCRSVGSVMILNAKGARELDGAIFGQRHETVKDGAHRVTDNLNATNVRERLEEIAFSIAMNSIGSEWTRMQQNIRLENVTMAAVSEAKRRCYGHTDIDLVDHRSTASSRDPITDNDQTAMAAAFQCPFLALETGDHTPPRQGVEALQSVLSSSGVDKGATWYHSEGVQRYKDNWSFSGLERHAFDHQAATSILFHGPSDLWVSNPPLWRGFSTHQAGLESPSETSTFESFPRTHRHLLVVPGSFNPLHPGHLRMAYGAEAFIKDNLGHQDDTGSRKQVQVIFEMALKRYGKSHDDLLCLNDDGAIEHRIELFRHTCISVLLTRAERFREKVDVLRSLLVQPSPSVVTTTSDGQSVPCVWFAIGFDTYDRILDCYPSSLSLYHDLQAMDDPTRCHVRFIVCPRNGYGGREGLIHAMNEKDNMDGGEAIREAILAYFTSLDSTYFPPSSLSSTMIRQADK